MSAQIHPVALFSILEAYTRRSEGSTRVIGTLLGKYVDSVATTDRSVVIEGAFAIPYYEKDGEIGIHKEYAEQVRRRVGCWGERTELTNLRAVTRPGNASLTPTPPLSPTLLPSPP